MQIGQDPGVGLQGDKKRVTEVRSRAGGGGAGGWRPSCVCVCVGGCSSLGCERLAAARNWAGLGWAGPRAAPERAPPTTPPAPAPNHSSRLLWSPSQGSAEAPQAGPQAVWCPPPQEGQAGRPEHVVQAWAPHPWRRPWQVAQLGEARRGPQSSGSWRTQGRTGEGWGEAGWWPT